MVTNYLKLFPEDYQLIPKKSISENFLKMAKDYAIYLEPDNKLNRKRIEVDSLGYLNWVLEKYCIIPKDKVLRYYESAIKQSQVASVDPRDAYEIADARSQILVLENIFGKEFFKNDNRDQ